MGIRILHIAMLAACMAAAGCANVAGIAPGTPADTVESSAGKPFRVWPESGGGASWEYPQGPEGRYTYMVRFGADGRATGVDQVLRWDTFRRITRGLPVAEVEHLLGRPYSKVTLPLTGQTAWAWRFVDTVWYRCFYAYVGPDGRVTGIGTRDEESGDQGIVIAIPC